METQETYKSFTEEVEQLFNLNHGSFNKIELDIRNAIKSLNEKESTSEGTSTIIKSFINKDLKDLTENEAKMFLGGFIFASTLI